MQYRHLVCNLNFWLIIQKLDILLDRTKMRNILHSRCAAHNHPNKNFWEEWAMKSKLDELLKIARLSVTATPETRHAGAEAARDAELTVTEFLRIAAIANAARSDSYALRTLVEGVNEEINTASRDGNSRYWRYRPAGVGSGTSPVPRRVEAPATTSGDNWRRGSDSRETGLSWFSRTKVLIAEMASIVSLLMLFVWFLVREYHALFN
jgi:hypothetical protein